MVDVAPDDTGVAVRLAATLPAAITETITVCLNILVIYSITVATSQGQTVDRGPARAKG